MGYQYFSVRPASSRWIPEVLVSRRQYRQGSFFFLLETSAKNHFGLRAPVGTRGIHGFMNVEAFVPIFASSMAVEIPKNCFVNRISRAIGYRAISLSFRQT